jgi:hypothetical protein
MTVTLNRLSYVYAQKLISNRRCELDEGDRWTYHKPARAAQKRFIEEHGLAEFAWWHLGEDDEQAPNSKRRYQFPYGDFDRVHRCAVLAAEARAARCEYADIEWAAAHLCGLLDALMELQIRRPRDQGHVRSR